MKTLIPQLDRKLHEYDVREFLDKAYNKDDRREMRKKLKKLGFSNYEQYLVSPYWTKVKKLSTKKAIYPNDA